MLLEKELKKFLENYENLVIMGIGNELKTDDGLGPYIINYLTPKLKNKNNVTLINAGSAPENFTGKIKTLNPSVDSN